MQEQVIFECTVCKNHNYSSSKNKKNVTERIEIKKYCKFCKKHTAHKEKK